MEIDEYLVTFCKKFADLEEPEKDYILDVSQALVHLISVKKRGIQKANNKRNTHILHTYKEYLA